MLCLVAPVSAVEPPMVYQPAGAPANPKVSARWNLYRNYAEATELVKQLAAAHPEFCKLQSLGQSHGGREMWLLTITDFSRGNPDERPAFWIDGGIHANEIQATEVVLYTAWYLLEARTQSKFLQQLLADRVFYIMPMMSPDSRDDHLEKPNTTHSPRTGLRPVDDDGDGLVDEDSPDDLDSDGHITQMRIRDPHGRWKPHPDFPQLMIRAKPDEVGEYTLMNTEGFDNDGDGSIDEDGAGYYDPNRDWPWNWQPKYVQMGAHRYPLSVLENRLVADYIAAHPHIAGAQSFHNAGGMILRGPGVKDDKYERSDEELLKHIAAHGEKLLPGYKSMEVADELYEMYGGEIDWLYSARGVLCFTNELFTAYNYFHNKPEGFFGTPEEAHRFDKWLLFGDGMVKWHAVEHPNLGPIEVGGMKKTWLRQPPSFLLEEECHRNMAFTLYHADQMPQVTIGDVTKKELPGGIFEVTAVVANERMIPTRTAADVNRKLSPPDRVTLSGDNLQVLAGLVSDDQFFTQPKEQPRRPATLQIEAIPGMSARYVRWLVKAEGPLTVEIRSTKGGVARKVLEAE
jgi:hypothetical protein